jgi:hypothetical protein
MPGSRGHAKFGEEGRGVVEVCIAGRREDRISLFEQRGGGEFSSE